MPLSSKTEKWKNVLFQHNAKNTPIANNVIIIDIGIILLL